MHRLLLLAISLFCLKTALFNAQQKDRNQIRGRVLNGQSRKAPVAGAVIKALDSQGHPIALSIPGITNADGKFVMIVPAQTKLFNLMVYDPDERYWVYQPNGEIVNDTHPNDLGTLYLDPRSVALDQKRVLEQFEAANIIKKFDSRSGNLLMSYLSSDYTDLVPGQCSAYETRAQRDPLFLEAAQTSQSFQPSEDIIRQIQANEKNVRNAFESIHSAELKYKGLHSTFAPLRDLAGAQLINRQLADGFGFGFCFVLSLSEKPLAPAAVSESRNNANRPKTSYFGYHLNASPLTPGVTGAHVFDSDESGEVRARIIKARSRD
jgi:hypothetical protein